MSTCWWGKSKAKPGSQIHVVRIRIQISRVPGQVWAWVQCSSGRKQVWEPSVKADPGERWGVPARASQVTLLQVASRLESCTVRWPWDQAGATLREHSPYNPCQDCASFLLLALHIIHKNEILFQELSVRNPCGDSASISHWLLLMSLRISFGNF